MNGPFKKEDYVNGNEIRWCPGCGDYAILAALQKVLPELAIPPHQLVFVSGIGCAGRLPYYMNAYGYHTIHGRALSVATGLKLMREDLSVWVITGDGDALSIGGNHLIHCLRRNVDINILLFNNEIYGLTKGQCSPTPPVGQVTKTSPFGVSQEAVNPLKLALASGASFVARAVDKDPAQLATILKAANEHRGSSFVEIYQDCNIFNNGAFDAFAAKANRAENTLLLKSGEPLLYGAENQSLLLEKEGRFEKTTVAACGGALSLHDPSNQQKAFALTNLKHPEYPVPLGIFFQTDKPTLQRKAALGKSRVDLEHLYRARASWVAE